MRPAAHDTDLSQRLARIVMLVCFMIALVVFAAASVARDGDAAAAPATPAVVGAAAPIAAEAGPFGVLQSAVPPVAEAPRRSTAHPRTLATFRSLRAFPGAPPRVPHGLTPEELRTTRCTTCHARGGWVARFAAYAPVTPHPELEACLQCHALDDPTAGHALPDPTPDAICRQCHDPGNPVSALSTAASQDASWPALSSASDGTPPPLPHALQLRENCQACHAGPAAVAEIRTTHPERTDCRQCHVALEADGVFARAPAAAATMPGGRP